LPSTADGGTAAHKDGGSSGGGGKRRHEQRERHPQHRHAAMRSRLHHQRHLGAGSAPPADFAGGCWPDGTWTFTTTVTTNSCPTAPVLEKQ